MADLQADAGQWLSQSEAALRLGGKLNRVIAARRSGRLQARKGNRGEWLVLVPAGIQAEPEPGPDPAEAEPGAGGPEPGRAPAGAGHVRELREEMAELKHARGRAEGGAEAMLQLVSGLAATL